jgi:hypothetical protein
MDAIAATVDVSTVACLSEPRIVDALFDGCSALLIREQDHDSPQCRRLRERGIPFAMLGPNVMADLAEGDRIVVDGQRLSVGKR